MQRGIGSPQDETQMFSPRHPSLSSLSASSSPRHYEHLISASLAGVSEVRSCAAQAVSLIVTNQNAIFWSRSHKSPRVFTNNQPSPPFLLPSGHMTKVIVAMLCHTWPHQREREEWWEEWKNSDDGSAVELYVVIRMVNW